MSRLSTRTRLIDIHKKLPIVKLVKEFEDDNNDTTPLTSVDATNHTSSTTNITFTTCNSHLFRLKSSSPIDLDRQKVPSNILKKFKTICLFSNFNSNYHIFVRCIKFLVRKQLLKQSRLSLKLLIHMNETIHRHLVKLLLIYAQEEVC